MSTQQTTKWVLSACSSEVAELGDVMMHQFPFRIGRYNNLELTLSTRTISGLHASITHSNGCLYIEDSQSRNGTFVNGDQVKERQLIQSGDLIQIAQAVFRLENNDHEEVFSRTINPLTVDNALAIVEFDKLMTEELVVPHYQSIVELETGVIMGYEALARGSTGSLRSPKAMFDVAARMRQESSLSRLLRRIATETAGELNNDYKLFLNSHHCEAEDPEKMIESLAEVREAFPARKMVLEIHESTVTELKQMQFISEELRKLEVEVAYDDFGAGQARFFELIEEPPTYLKFDIRLMKNIHEASIRRRKTIEGLVNMVKSLGIICLAEGIEVEDEAKACLDIGFELAQGYFYSRPVTMDAVLSQPAVQ